MSKDEFLRRFPTFEPLGVLKAIADRFGFEQMARRLQQSPGLLYARLGEAENRATSVQMAIAMTEIADDDAFLEAWARERDGVFIKLPPTRATDDDVLENLEQLVESFGTLCGNLRRARQDGVIDPTEYKRLHADGGVIHQQLESLLAEINTVVRDLPADRPNVTALPTQR